MEADISSPKKLFGWLKSSGLLTKYGLNKVGVFGSFARNEPYADIDLLVDDPVINWKLLRGFCDEFQEKTRIKLDIMVRQYAEPLILKSAEKDLIYEA